VSVPCSSIMMLTISLASLRMRTVSHAGALPPWSGRLATPVRYIAFQFSLIMIACFVIIFAFLYTFMYKCPVYAYYGVLCFGSCWVDLFK
jgi:hypothetical protein